jgi:hypothetical protein
MALISRLLRTGLLLLLAVCANPAAMAQETKEAAPGGEEAGKTFEPGHLAAARSFIEATGADDLAEQVLIVFKPQVENVVRSRHPDVTEAKIARFMELFVAKFREREQVFDEAADRIFAGFISRQDLDEGIAFYRSPAGRGFVEARPKIAASMGKVGKTGLTVEDVVAHLSREDRQAYRDFVASDLGKRLADAQAKIHHVWVRFGARIGLDVSGRAGSDAIRQMEKEGNGL